MNSGIDTAVFPTNPQTQHDGISMRQWYAAMALQGLVAHGLEVRSDRVLSDDDRDNIFAEKAFALADAMMRFEQKDQLTPA